MRLSGFVCRGDTADTAADTDDGNDDVFVVSVVGRCLPLLVLPPPNMLFQPKKNLFGFDRGPSSSFSIPLLLLLLEHDISRLYLF